jgi:hypothetical protein
LARDGPVLFNIDKKRSRTIAIGTRVANAKEWEEWVIVNRDRRRFGGTGKGLFPCVGLILFFIIKNIKIKINYLLILYYFDIDKKRINPINGSHEHLFRPPAGN